MSAPFFIHLSSPPGEGGLAVFELYGAGAGPALSTVLGGKGLPEENRTRLGVLSDENGDQLDEVVIGRQPASSMWSGLDAFTLSVHGGIWLQERTARLLVGLGAERLDSRGVLELSVSKGALDAVRAAAFEHLVAARTDRAAQFFCRQHAGELSEILSRCIDLASEDTEAPLVELERTLSGLLKGSRRACRLGKPLKLLLAGRANSGKSTLFNRFVESERVAVSSQPGTTRDFIRDTVAVSDYPVELSDSVGLRQQPADIVEAEALCRLAEQEADGWLYLLTPPWKLTSQDRGFVETRGLENTVIIGNKADKARAEAQEDAEILISALHGDGFEALLEVISGKWLDARRSAMPGQTVDPSAPFTASQVEWIEKALSALVKTPGTPLLDEVKRCLIICLQSSWPQNCASASS